MQKRLDLLVVHPGSGNGVYGDLAEDLVAVEPPLWARLIAGYVRDRGFEVRIIDAEAMRHGPQQVAIAALDANPRLVCIAAYGHQPSASTQMMTGAGAVARAIKEAKPDLPIIMVGGHVAALPERTLREEAIDFACNGEGPSTIVVLLKNLEEAKHLPVTASHIAGLVWRDHTRLLTVNPPAPLIDINELHGDVWDLLPMRKYRAHNWQAFGDLAQRQPYASIHTSLGCPYKCLAGDTVVNTIYGRFPIKELAEAFGDHGVPVYTYDPETRQAKIAQAINIRRYGQNEKMVRVHFDDGTHIDCTPDHKFLQFKWGNRKSQGGQWECEAKDLPAGAHVRALRFEVHPKGRTYVTWGRRDRKFRSRMIMEFLHERRLARSEHVHHDDENVGNDHPSNLEVCASPKDHFAKHPEIAERMRTNNPTKNGMGPEWRENLGAANRGKVRSLESRKRYRESKLGDRNPNFRHGERTGTKSRLAEVNHRVVSVEALETTGDVYCMTVPETGWFFANDVLVKNCTFCCINAPFQSNRYRMRDPAKVCAEIANLYFDHGVRTFKIVDEMFVLNEAHYTAVCKGLADRGIADRLNIWAYARVDTVKPETLGILRAGGVRWLALGIESADPKVRDGASKQMRPRDIKDVVRQIQGAGINVIGNYIFGLPDDDRESMEATLALATDLNTEFANFYSAMAYPGSKLYADAVRDKAMLPSSWSGYSQHSADCTPLDTKYIPSAEVLRFRDAAFQHYFRNPAYLSTIEAKFGTETREHVVAMANRKLQRNLIEWRHTTVDPGHAQTVAAE